MSRNRSFKVEAIVNFKKALLSVAKFTFLFTCAVYLLSLPSFAFLIAYPHGIADALLPFEVALCIGLSGVMFLWSFKTVYEALKI